MKRTLMVSFVSVAILCVAPALLISNGGTGWENWLPLWPGGYIIIDGHGNVLEYETGDDEIEERKSKVTYKKKENGDNEVTVENIGSEPIGVIIEIKDSEGETVTKIEAEQLAPGKEISVTYDEDQTVEVYTS